VGKRLFIEQNNVRQDSTYPARVKKKKFNWEHLVAFKLGVKLQLTGG
jgi:hypothetical protein